MTTAGAVANQEKSEDGIASDTDSLYAMPLNIVPFETPRLRRGRLIKNAALESAIELYGSDNGGSAQILVSDVTPAFGQANFGWPMKELHPDLALLHRLAKHPSYDVYSLRVLFRNLGFSVDSMQYLTLSDEKKRMLNGHMKIFTRPLMKQIYGDSFDAASGAESIIDCFTNPNTPNARENLEKVADQLNLPIEKIPAFLEDFADIYMSLSYYQQSLEAIVPLIVDMVAQVNELKQNWHLKNDAVLQRTCAELASDIWDLTAATTGRFESFHKHTEKMWEEISADRFRSMEKMIRSYHTIIGGLLCGLQIKMTAWNKRFPNADVGGPMARTEFLHSSMRPGMARIKAINSAAPPVPKLDA